MTKSDHNTWTCTFPCLVKCIIYSCSQSMFLKCPLGFRMSPSCQVFVLRLSFYLIFFTFSPRRINWSWRGAVPFFSTFSRKKNPRLTYGERNEETKSFELNWYPLCAFLSSDVLPAFTVPDCAMIILLIIVHTNKSWGTGVREGLHALVSKSRKNKEE